MSFFIRATLLSSVLLGSIATTFASPQPIDKRANPSFQADGSINAAGIYSAASSGSKVLATYAPDQGASKSVKIYGDWEKLSGVSAYYFKADMDIDCDGPDVGYLPASIFHDTLLTIPLVLNSTSAM